MVDENGSFIRPDRLMEFSSKVLSDLPDTATEEQRTIFFDVKCSMALEEAIEELEECLRCENPPYFHEKELRKFELSMAGRCQAIS